MDIKIKEETLRNTRKCNKDFSCLSNCKQKDLCKVLSRAGNDRDFRILNKNSECHYRMRFGDSYTCTCPTRIDLYREHQI